MKLLSGVLSAFLILLPLITKFIYIMKINNFFLNFIKSN